MNKGVVPDWNDCELKNERRRILQTSHTTKAQHSTFLSSKREVLILCLVILPLAYLLLINVGNYLHCRSIWAEPISHISFARTVTLHWFLRKFNAALVNFDGLVLEFGVYSGNSISHFAILENWTVDGFDSFDGLPEPWRDGFGVGAFKVDKLPEVRDNVRLHKGWFSESIPSYI